MGPLAISVAVPRSVAAQISEIFSERKVEQAKC